MNKQKNTQDHLLKKIVIEESVRLTDNDKLMEYLWLRPFQTNLKVDVFVDDSGAFERYGHPLVLYVRNGYDKESSDFIPFLVSNKPQVLDDNMDFHISYEDIFSVMDLIQENQKLLVGLAKGTIEASDFVSELKQVSYYEILVESKNILLEMATLRASKSNLPVDIWLDEGVTFQGHAPRIKFRASNEQRTTRDFSTMLITDPTQIENLPSNSPLRKKDIEKLQRFVNNNKDLLLRLAKGEISYLNDFLPNMKCE